MCNIYPQYIARHHDHLSSATSYFVPPLSQKETNYVTIIELRSIKSNQSGQLNGDTRLFDISTFISYDSINFTKCSRLLSIIRLLMI